jgi:hypothetical protein
METESQLMGFDHEGPGGANFDDQVCGRPAVQWEDAAEVERWFEAVRDAVKDLRGAGRDRSRRRRKRVLSRFEASRQVGESSKRALSLLSAGETGWRSRFSPCDPGRGPERGPKEDDPPFSSSRPTTPETAS